MKLQNGNLTRLTPLKNKTLILWFLVLLKFIIHLFLINPQYDLHRDEYLHLDQAKHLAWGYLSIPPLTSWISYLILQLGNSIFWVKFFPALFGVLTMLVVWKTIEELKGNLFALTLGAVAIIFSAITRLNILYQPNSLDILLWTLFYFTIIKYINSENKKWLWLGSLTFAFGFLNKYNIAFLILSLLPALVMTEQRRIFLNKHFYFSIGLALLIISPNLIWQYNNSFPVLHHLNELAETQLVNVNRADFLKDQILFFIGSIFVLIAALISFFTYKPFKKFQIFFWLFLFTLILFIYFKAKGYYAIGLYPIYVAFGAVYLEYILNDGWKIYLRPILIAIPILMFIPIAKVAFPIFSPAVILEKGKLYKDRGLLRWEDGKDHSLPQDFADMLGWKELAVKADSAYKSISDPQQTLVLCDNYGQAGAINYYSRAGIQAVSFNADYINWFPLERKIKNVILVKEAKDAENRDREKLLFDEVSEFGKINNSFAREYGTSIYILKNAKVNVNRIIQKEIEERKNFH